MNTFKTSRKSILDKIYDSYSSLNNLTIKYSFFLTIGYALLTLCIVFWTLNKGLNFVDEAWFLLHMKDLPYIAISEWPLYAKAIFPSDLLTIRYITVSLLILSGVLVSIGMTRIFKEISLIGLIPVSIIAIFIFRNPVQYVPNYVFFSLIIFNTGIFFYLLMLSGRTLYFKYIWGICSGFIFGQLFFIMITNTPYIGLIFASIIFMKNHRRFIIHYWISMLAGILSAGIFFFCTFKSFHSFINDCHLSLAYFKNVGDSLHGISAVHQWAKLTFIYFIMEILIPAYLLFFIVKNISIAKLTKFLAMISFLGYVALMIFMNFANDHLHVSSPSLIYIFSLAFIVILVEMRDWQNIVLIFLMFFIPFFGSLGTGLTFEARSTEYLTPIIVILFIFLKQNDFSKLTLVFHVFILIVLIRFSTIFIVKPGWQHYIIKNQKTELSSIDIPLHIKLDDVKIAEVKELKAIIPAHSMVLSNFSHYWGFIYLLELKVPYYYCSFTDISWENYYSSKHEKLKELYLMEGNKDNSDFEELFPKSVKQNPDIIKLDTIPLKMVKGMTLYKATFK